MFAEQEAMLKAKMDILSVQREAAVADAEYLGLKEGLDISDEEPVCDQLDNSVILNKYLNEQPVHHERDRDSTRNEVSEDKPTNKESALKVNFPTVAQTGTFSNLLDSNQNLISKESKTNSICKPSEISHIPDISVQPVSSLNVHAPHFHPTSYSRTAQSESSQHLLSEFAN
jgi:hypothetical protein